MKDGVTVWLVEGEKDVDNLRKIGLVSTCNPDGALFEITHDAVHGVKDTYTPDASGMGRPE